MSIQLGGNLKLGPTGSLVDVSNYVSRFSINVTRASVTTPATLGLPRESEKAGVTKETLTIEFFSDFAATSLWAQLWDAIHLPTAELDFSGNFEPGVTSTSNPVFTGRIVVMNLDSGAKVGELRSNSVTCPVTSAGVTKASF